MEKQAKTKRQERNPDKVRECQQQCFLKFKEANPDKVKQVEKQAKTKRQECNIEIVREWGEDKIFVNINRQIQRKSNKWRNKQK